MCFYTTKYKMSICINIEAIFTYNETLGIIRFIIVKSIICIKKSGIKTRNIDCHFTHFCIIHIACVFIKDTK